MIPTDTEAGAPQRTALDRLLHRWLRWPQSLPCPNCKATPPS